MSEDRFKQARRSLIDRHNQRQQQGPAQDDFDDEFEDEATALVDMNSVHRAGAPQFAPPPNFQNASEEATKMVPRAGVPRPGQPPRPPGAHHPGHPPSGGHGHGAPPPSHDPFARSGGGQQPGHGGPHGAQGGFAQGGVGMQQGPQHEPPRQRQQVMIGDDAGFEGNTQFVNIAQFAQDGPALTPDESAAGFEGHTQFVDINALQAQHASGGGTIEQDQVLRQSYQFGPESIQHGEFTLIFAQNALGKPVVLKRIWEGDPSTMPQEVRQRVAMLDQIRHPRLVSLNGLIASPTGAWVELDRPMGYRLSDIILQNGAQDPETVVGWIKQAGEVLDAVHQYQFAYANMTPDAIWIQQDGTVVVEPFDILAFEHRGNLGEFGPPEMQRPPEQRQVSPATDVYSLAAVTAIALTGPPLNAETIGALDKKYGKTIQAALNPNPAERPQSIAAFVEGFSKSGGLPDLDFKFLIIGVAAIGLASLGTVYYLQQQRAAAAAAYHAHQQQQQAVQQKEAQAAELPPDEAGAEEQAAADAPSVKVAGAPGPVSEDPRLTISTSFRSNPASENASELVVDQKAADAARAEARAALEGVDKLAPQAKAKQYEQALVRITRAVRLSGGEPTAEDRQFIEDLFSHRTVHQTHKGYMERIDRALRERKLGTVKSLYPQLAGIDPGATEQSFFSRNKTPGIKKLERQQDPSQSDEAQSDEAKEDEEP